MLNLYAASRFDLGCTDWVGGGSFDEVDGDIRFNFAILSKHGSRVDKPPPMTFEKSQTGNHLTLTIRHGSSYRLERHL
ncbi:hypothetical protein [Fimbriimonas ginsengisoli]|uniref:Uncharacterized protein n=1 Tax=Fimbriimonas ginsengisoli Gsoil 348 TaxID=661478 RepID=A0A068NSD5_FIMGI|nr:hypothetical protein [Fimbriimonas ginsengisoli]AIE86262.1 hypothetical protein OP10G_2894 [Fimbriimonas ginsengisoli Gsoil 348]